MSAMFSTAELSAEGNRESHMLLPLDLLSTSDHPPAALSILHQLGRVSDIWLLRAWLLRSQVCYNSWLLWLFLLFGLLLLLNLTLIFDSISSHTFLPPIDSRSLLSTFSSLNHPCRLISSSTMLVAHRGVLLWKPV